MWITLTRQTTGKLVAVNMAQAQCVEDATNSQHQVTGGIVRFGHAQDFIPVRETVVQILGVVNARMPALPDEAPPCP